MEHIFISHSANDRELANKICAALEAANLSCWIAPRDVPVGGQYTGAIVDAIEGSSIILVLLSEDAANSGHVMREFDIAISAKKKIIPFKIGNFVQNSSMRYFLSHVQWTELPASPTDADIDIIVSLMKGLPVQAAPFSSTVETKSKNKRKTLVIALASLVILGGFLLLMFSFKESPEPVATTPAKELAVKPKSLKLSLPALALSEAKKQKEQADKLAKEPAQAASQIPSTLKRDLKKTLPAKGLAESKKIPIENEKEPQKSAPVTPESYLIKTVPDEHAFAKDYEDIVVYIMRNILQQTLLIIDSQVSAYDQVLKSARTYSNNPTKANKQALVEQVASSKKIIARQAGLLPQISDGLRQEISRFSLKVEDLESLLRMPKNFPDNIDQALLALPIVLDPSVILDPKMRSDLLDLGDELKKIYLDLTFYALCKFLEPVQPEYLDRFKENTLTSLTNSPIDRPLHYSKGELKSLLDKVHSKEKVALARLKKIIAAINMTSD